MHRKSSKPLTINRRLFLLSMASLLTLSLLFLFLHHPSAESPASPLILAACKSTRFPDSCISALSLDLTLTPETLIPTALSAAAAALPAARSLVLSIPADNPDRSAAVRNCLDHLSLSSRRLSSSPISQSLAGAALQYQYDCWSALKYVNSTRRVYDAMSSLASLAHLTSNALSIIFATRRFGPEPSLWVPPQTERDGYWGDGDGHDDNHIQSNPSGIGIPLSPNITVCKTGECDYTTIQKAVDAAPDYESDRFVICIKAGTYEETVRILFEKTNLVLVGDGMGRTIVTGSLNAQMPGISTYNTATFAVFGDGFMARNLTFRNDAGAGAHQAVAFMSDSDRSVLESVEFAGHQDTLYARSLRQLYRWCRISGTVDFIFGNAAAVFEDCFITVVPRIGSPEKGETNAVTAQGRIDPAQATGFVFRNSTVDGSEEYLEFYHRRPGRHKVYLGRPWKEFSRTVFVDCYLGEVVRPEGWLPWRGEFALGTLFYGEFGSSGPGANASARVGWSSQIPGEHVGAYSTQNFIQGDEWISSGR